jgi:hypothetical protein
MQLHAAVYHFHSRAAAESAGLLSIGIGSEQLGYRSSHEHPWPRHKLFKGASLGIASTAWLEPLALVSDFVLT